MLYKIGHILRDHLPCLWTVFGRLNSCLFMLCYSLRLREEKNVLSRWFSHQFRLLPLTESILQEAEHFFQQQPKEAFRYFQPHGFTQKDLRELARDRSFLAYFVTTTDECPKWVGYFFMRSFVWGVCYRGYITDYRWRRRGINQLMNSCATELASTLGLHTFGTISPQNIASMKSVQKVNDIRVIKQLDNGDSFVEYLPKINSEQK